MGQNCEGYRNHEGYPSQFDMPRRNRNFRTYKNGKKSPSHEPVQSAEDVRIGINIVVGEIKPQCRRNKNDTHSNAFDLKEVKIAEEKRPNQMELFFNCERPSDAEGTGSLRRAKDEKVL